MTKTDVRAAAIDTDRELVARCRTELPYRTDGFAELLERYEPTVLGFCERYLGRREDAEEVTQDVFLRVFHHLPRFEGRSNFRTWLFRIATNECATRYRRLRRRREVVDEFAREAPPSPARDPEIGSDELEGPVAAALQGLKPTDREVLLLRHVSELPIQEVADALGLGLSATKMRLYRAEERLRSALEKPV